MEGLPVECHARVADFLCTERLQQVGLRRLQAARAALVREAAGRPLTFTHCGQTTVAGVRIRVLALQVGGKDGRLTFSVTVKAVERGNGCLSHAESTAYFRGSLSEGDTSWMLRRVHATGTLAHFAVRHAHVLQKGCLCAMEQILARKELWVRGPEGWWRQRFDLTRTPELQGVCRAWATRVAPAFESRTAAVLSAPFDTDYATCLTFHDEFMLTLAPPSYAQRLQLRKRPRSTTEDNEARSLQLARAQQWSARTLRYSTLTCGDQAEVPVTAQRLRRAGFKWHELVTAGFSARELRKAGLGRGAARAAPARDATCE